MTQPLPVSRLVRVSVNLQPLAAPRRNFGTLLLAGDSDVINAVERIRNYTTLEGVASDFGTSAPEYTAAALYFGQSPRPQNLSIGRWLRTASSALLRGGILTAAQQQMSNWTVITNGAFTISVDGTPQTVSGLDFTYETNLNGVASEINSVLTGATIAWTGERFEITSNTTGISSELSYATTPGSGTDISALLKLTSATALEPIPGFAAETPVEAAEAFVEVSGAWYGLIFAASVQPSQSQNLAVAEFIEGVSRSRIFGITDTNTLTLDSSYTADIASELKDLDRKRTSVLFSPNPYAITSMFGRAFTVNFNANRSTITLMYKQLPGVLPELLTETQATTLKNKRCNVYAEYDNETAIVQYGTMSGNAWFDEIHGLDWFKDAIENACYNLLYQSKTKIPQTDAGVNQLVTAIAAVCEEAVNNGLVAPGVWNADGFGQLERGDYLKSGYYIYAQPIALQTQAVREQRIAPPIQVAVKLAGAIQELDIIIDVNR